MTLCPPFGGKLIAAATLIGVYVFSATVLGVDAETKVGQAAIEEAAHKAAAKATEKVLEKAAEKVAEKAEEKAAEKAELIARPPEEWRGLTTVHFFVFVLDIDQIDDANQSFSANVFVRLRWTDKRLADPKGTTRQMPLQEVWNPQVVLANRVGLLPTALPKAFSETPLGKRGSPSENSEQVALSAQGILGSRFTHGA